MTFAKDLKTYRKSRGLTQKQAGELVGVSDAAWARWESGRRLMPLRLLRLLDPPTELWRSWGITHGQMQDRKAAVDRSRKPGPCPLTMALHLERVGWTATQLAKESGVPEGVIYRWLAGKSQPIAAYWEALGKVCPSCLSNPHPMGRALLQRYRSEGGEFSLAFWLKDLEASNG